MCCVSEWMSACVRVVSQFAIWAFNLYLVMRVCVTAKPIWSSQVDPDIQTDTIIGQCFPPIFAFVVHWAIEVVKCVSGTEIHEKCSGTKRPIWMNSQRSIYLRAFSPSLVHSRQSSFSFRWFCFSFWSIEHLSNHTIEVKKVLHLLCLWRSCSCLLVSS